MGTNFYWIGKSPCKECGREFEDAHIGKSSSGWVFALHVYPDGSGPRSLEEWIERFYRKGSSIRDEYGKNVSPEEMVKNIAGRYWGGPPGRLVQNGAMEGPHGLMRCKIDGCSVLAHGAGTWDLHTGDFS